MVLQVRVCRIVSIASESVFLHHSYVPVRHQKKREAKNFSKATLVAPLRPDLRFVWTGHFQSLLRLGSRCAGSVSLQMKEACSTTSRRACRRKTLSYSRVYLFVRYLKIINNQQPTTTPETMHSNFLSECLQPIVINRAACLPSSCQPTTWGAASCCR